MHAALLRLQADLADGLLDVLIVGLVGVRVDAAAAGGEPAFAGQIGDPRLGREFDIPLRVFHGLPALLLLRIPQVGEQAQGRDVHAAGPELIRRLPDALRGDPLQGADAVVGPSRQVGLDEAELGAFKPAVRHALSGVGNRQTVEGAGRDADVEHIGTSCAIG